MKFSKYLLFIKVKHSFLSLLSELKKYNAYLQLFLKT